MNESASPDRASSRPSRMASQDTSPARLCAGDRQRGAGHDGQPGVSTGRGNWLLHEDGDGPEVGRNNDLWLCLPDGDDVDTLSDGCVRIATLNDLTAEWTGGIFDRWGDHFYVSVQHNATGHGVVLDITGWR